MESLPVNKNIALSEIEKKLFGILLEYVHTKSLSVVLRSAGGWVRDKILARESSDIDITVDTLTGEQFISGFSEYLCEIGKDDLISGHGVIKSNPDKSKHLETVTFKIFGLDIDVANLRHEEYASNSRIPTMKFGTPLQDAQRRDLTINSLFYNLHTQEVEDYTGQGMTDLKNGIIRTPLEPVQTFTDDPLRVLRTLRFATRYQFQILPEIKSAVKNEEIREALLKKVSRERVRTELQKILQDTNVEYGLQLIQDYNLWSIVFAVPETSVELKDQKFREDKCKESYDMAIKAVKYFERIEKFKISSESEINYFDRQLLFLLSAIFFPYQGLHPVKKDKMILSVPNYLVLESLKFPDNKNLKVCSIVSSACLSAAKFTDISQNISGLTEKFDEIALMIKELGNTWEIALQVAALSASNEEAFKQISEFIESKELSRIYSVKPFLDGKEIMKLFPNEKGQVIGKINKNIFLWQARNPRLQPAHLLAAIKDTPETFTS